MLTIDFDTIVTLLLACEEAMDMLDKRVPIDDEDKALKEQTLMELEAAHSLLQVAFSGVRTIEPSAHTRH